MRKFKKVGVHGVSVFFSLKLGHLATWTLGIYWKRRITGAGGAVYIHAFYWFGKQIHVQNARRLFKNVTGDILRLNAELLATGQEIKAAWDGDVLVLSNLPDNPPDKSDTVIRLRGN